MIKTFLIVLILAIGCLGQDIDAPTPQPDHSCPAWVQKLVGSCQQETVEERMMHTPKPRDHQASFLKFKGKYEPPLRTNKEALTAINYILTHGAYATSVIIACKRKQSGEDFASELPPIPVILGGDLLLSRFVGQPLSLIPPLYGIAHYIHSSLK